jgi:hypothetical protein
LRAEQRSEANGGLPRMSKAERESRLSERQRRPERQTEERSKCIGFSLLLVCRGYSSRTLCQLARPGGSLPLLHTLIRLPHSAVMSGCLPGWLAGWRLHSAHLAPPGWQARCGGKALGGAVAASGRRTMQPAMLQVTPSAQPCTHTDHMRRTQRTVELSQHQTLNEIGIASAPTSKAGRLPATLHR